MRENQKVRAPPATGWSLHRDGLAQSACPPGGVTASS